MINTRDPAQIRVGINLASLDDEAKAAKVAATLNEVLARSLNLFRLVIVAAPVVIQSCYIHSVDLQSWVLRLISIYALTGVVVALVAPEQAFNGMALREMRWFFERMYPEAAHWNGSPAPEAADGRRSVSLLRIGEAASVSGVLARVRWHGTDKYLCLDVDGWAAPGDENFAVVVILQQVVIKGESIPDTYLLRVRDDSGRWGESWLGCTPVNQLRLGGWLRACSDESKACPLKLLQDSSCPAGSCKLLTAWPTPPQHDKFGHGGVPSSGFYLAEQRHSGRLYVGQGVDADASLFELVLAES